MNSPRVTYTPRPDATPEAEICALVSVYAFILQKNQERQRATRLGSPDDAERRSDEIGARTSIQRSS
jgi:hypothetical protein